MELCTQRCSFILSPRCLWLFLGHEKILGDPMLVQNPLYRRTSFYLKPDLLPLPSSPKARGGASLRLPNQAAKRAVLEDEYFGNSTKTLSRFDVLFGFFIFGPLQSSILLFLSTFRFLTGSVILPNFSTFLSLSSPSQQVLDFRGYSSISKESEKRI